MSDIDGEVRSQGLVSGDVEDDGVVVEAAAGEDHVVGRPSHDQRHLVENLVCVESFNCLISQEVLIRHNNFALMNCFFKKNFIEIMIFLVK